MRTVVGSVLALVVLSGTLTLPSAASARQDVDPTSCGRITPPFGPRLRLDVVGPSCKTGRTIIRRYYARAKTGRCQGNSCIAQVGRYRCSTASVGEQQRTGISTNCVLRRDEDYRIFTR